MQTTSVFLGGSILASSICFYLTPTKYVGYVGILFDGIERSSGFVNEIYSDVLFSTKKDAIEWANNQKIPKLKPMQGYCDPVAITNRGFVEGRFLDFSLRKEYRALDLKAHWLAYGHLQ